MIFDYNITKPLQHSRQNRDQSCSRDFLKRWPKLLQRRENTVVFISGMVSNYWQHNRYITKT